MADHETAKLDKSSHLLLDQPLLRLPYELLRKNFRSAHFVVERDSQQVRNLLRDTASASLDGRATPDDVLKNLDIALNRLRATRKKLAACAAEEARLYRQVDARLAHLSELASMHTVDDVKYEAWSRRRLDRLVVDYLLRHGYNASATALADEKNMRDLVEIETFVQMSRIQEALRNGSVTEALAWCNDNKKELRKLESKLEFMLRYQQYIELVRTQSMPKLIEAINHARKYFTPVRDTFPKEVNQAAGLLAIPPPDSHEAAHHYHRRQELDAAYEDLWSPDRWVMLADLFTQTHNQLLALPSSPLLHIALSSGLSALKTPACHSAGSKQLSDSHASSLAASVCPICSEELNRLARSVPYAHHSKSHVEHDLVLLPNGRVYGRARLEEYARKAGLAAVEVKDLRTGEVFAVSKLKKVFIT